MYQLSLKSIAMRSAPSISVNAHWFMSLEDAAEKLEAWRRDCNEERPHVATGNKVPADLMKSVHYTSP